MKAERVAAEAANTLSIDRRPFVVVRKRRHPGNADHYLGGEAYENLRRNQLLRLINQFRDCHSNTERGLCGRKAPFGGHAIHHSPKPRASFGGPLARIVAFWDGQWWKGRRGYRIRNLYGDFKRIGNVALRHVCSLSGQPKKGPQGDPVRCLTKIEQLIRWGTNYPSGRGQFLDGCFEGILSGQRGGRSYRCLRVRTALVSVMLPNLASNLCGGGVQLLEVHADYLAVQHTLDVPRVFSADGESYAQCSLSFTRLAVFSLHRASEFCCAYSSDNPKERPSGI